MNIPNKIMSLFELPVRVLGPTSSASYECDEGLADYTFTIPRIIRKKGVSCLIRVKNEEKKLAYVLESIKDVFDEIIVVDNASDDNTAVILEAYTERYGHIKTHRYPFELSKIGTQHYNTNKSSVHSFTYYTNWSISKCSYSYIFKWDGDMILDKRDITKLKTYLSSLSSWWPCFIDVEILTVYQNGDDFFYDKNEVNNEIEIFPLRADVYFDKHDCYELLSGKFYKQTKLRHKDIRIYEWKDTSEDEFAHWSTTDFTTERKKREWKNFHLVKESGGKSPIFKLMDKDTCFPCLLGNY